VHQCEIGCRAPFVQVGRVGDPSEIRLSAEVMGTADERPRLSA
jgi:hypothetical protein